VRVIPVSQCLDRKLRFMGFEVGDVLAVFLTLSILNLLFGQSSFKVALVWAPTVLLALILKYGKRGKPEKFILHWLRYQFSPGVYEAFPEATSEPTKEGNA